MVFYAQSTITVEADTERQTTECGTDTEKQTTECETDNSVTDIVKQTIE